MLNSGHSRNPKCSFTLFPSILYNGDPHRSTHGSTTPPTRVLQVWGERGRVAIRWGLDISCGCPKRKVFWHHQVPRKRPRNATKDNFHGKLREGKTSATACRMHNGCGAAAAVTFLARCHRIIDNSCGFATKVERVLTSISERMGLSVPTQVRLVFRDATLALPRYKTQRATSYCRCRCR